MTIFILRNVDETREAMYLNGSKKLEDEKIDMSAGLTIMEEYKDLIPHGKVELKMAHIDTAEFPQELPEGIVAEKQF